MQFLSKQVLAYSLNSTPSQIELLMPSQCLTGQVSVINLGLVHYQCFWGWPRLVILIMGMRDLSWVLPDLTNSYMRVRIYGVCQSDIADKLSYNSYLANSYHKATEVIYHFTCFHIR